ncbi:MAG TPA: SDR family NAD(P)-dependent oxidoreductase [Mycobacteriales bacterium]|jgi:NAD(P)-dependent dehydrogenase (short-subunit alcohol dehydrogenase family)|nr:SDR family NAD(P)-dependent oxidoreductase [Mycobacteriales bacterium]
MRLEGNVALITGGASGLGRATAARLVSAGTKVVIADLPGSPGADVARELGVVFAPTDVRDEAQVSAALDATAELGQLRIVVNCAGVGTPGRLLGKQGPLPLADFQRIIDINLVGTFNVMRLAAERISASEPVGEERGVIICTASVAAYEGQIGQAAYAASKGGVLALTITAARDLSSRQIRVMSIAPGVFATPMVAGLSEEAQASLGAQVPHPSRLGKPEEYASLVAAIVDNPMLNGETIRLDGAIRMAPR